MNFETATKKAEMIKIWEKIEIQVGEGDSAGVYLARIEDFINDGIIITDPELMRGHTLLRENADVFVYVRRDDAMYRFSSSIKRFLTSDNRQFILTPPRRYERVQRRMFVRVEMTKPLEYAVIGAPGTKGSTNGELSWIQSRSNDLSGGGILFQARDYVLPGSLVILRLDYFKQNDLPEYIVAVCRRCFIRNNIHFMGTQFVLSEALGSYLSNNTINTLPKDIMRFDQHNQNKLVSLIFGYQLQLRKKGLL